MIKMTNICLCLSLMVALAGCSSENTMPSTSEVVANSDSESVAITLRDGGTATNSQSVKIEGDSITISEEGSYILSGNLTDGQIIIDAQNTDKLTLILDDVTINSSTTAPIYIKQADKVFITLENENKLSTNGEFLVLGEDNIDAVIFSKGNLELSGEGTLDISTAFGNGITSKDDLIFTGGTLKITASGHGLDGKDNVEISNGSFEIISGKDGIHSENKDDTSLGFVHIENGSLNITAQGDGIDAGAYIKIDNGEFNITTEGKTEEASSKALKSDGNIDINDGSITLNSFDDTIHAATNITINGGDFTLSTEDDGIHADRSVFINDGNINILKSYEGIEGENITIEGGIIDILSSDDGLNSVSFLSSGTPSPRGELDENCYIQIDDGVININISGEFSTGENEGDGIDANGNLFINGGEIYISGTTSEKNGALDYNNEGIITGGILVAVGTAGRTEQTMSDTSTQGTILVNPTTKQTGAIVLKNADGSEILSFTPAKEYDSVVISTKDIEIGNTYMIEMGTESVTVQMTDIIYGSSSTMGGMPPFGGPPPNGERPPEGDEHPSRDSNPLLDGTRP